MPLCRSLGGVLWEVRTSLPGNSIARVLICFREDTLYALHGFVKKTRKAPVDALELARKRMKEILNG